ncbi:MAG: [Eubacterium sp.]|nr:[FeFe] hydrogenase H-cluster maturation GTPase HydF [Eubacterium sp.]
MGMNDTPSGERTHIGFFGKRNAGKSSVVNAVTGQDLAVVSPVEGTTTDPVSKAMELLPLGPVMIIDTPGFDDSGSLGRLRVRKTREILNRSDLAILVIDAVKGPGGADHELIDIFREKEIPYLIVYNKCDLLEELPPAGKNEIYVSATEKIRIQELKEMMAAAALKKEERKLLSDLISPGQRIVLVVPIDKAAPKGRLILPQQQVIREVLDTGAYAVCTREDGLQGLLEGGEDPDLIITDSQVFEQVACLVPEHIPMTSFSILMARYKGFLESAVEGCRAIDNLKDGSRILISEGCTHHRQCDDIGTVKIPAWIREYTGKEITFETSSGRSFPEDLSSYDLVIHCGGCMLNQRELRYRMKQAGDQNVPFTNYGTAIAMMKGILARSIRPVLSRKVPQRGQAE